MEKSFYGNGLELTVTCGERGGQMIIRAVQPAASDAAESILVEFWLQPVDEHWLATSPASRIWHRRLIVAKPVRNNILAQTILPPHLNSRVLGSMHVRLWLEPPSAETTPNET